MGPKRADRRQQADEKIVNETIVEGERNHSLEYCSSYIRPTGWSSMAFAEYEGFVDDGLREIAGTWRYECRAREMMETRRGRWVGWPYIVVFEVQGELRASRGRCWKCRAEDRY